MQKSVQGTSLLFPPRILDNGNCKFAGMVFVWKKVFNTKRSHVDCADDYFYIMSWYTIVYFDCKFTVVFLFFWEWNFENKISHNNLIAADKTATDDQKRKNTPMERDIRNVARSHHHQQHISKLASTKRVKNQSKLPWVEKTQKIRRMMFSRTRYVIVKAYYLSFSLSVHIRWLSHI